ncbi:AAA family ATPase [Candidatus Similichlamydia laticola]|uniref:DNA polymerase III delta prime subunit n=1 Tax=Candidatus Similichlamydia laticola TaxID=2170265 RepID=A0A369KD29_9BACT|nr:AAA family ATPase [Candidatus Similichlamydia laticola]RDB31512.1 DNA polymerase III delta prime subunit [Candidatus Similichlamydia laticola]
MKLVGHTNILKMAQKMCKNRPIVLFFEGPKGVGKWLCAQHLARLTSPEHAIQVFEPKNQLQTYSVSAINNFCSISHMYPWQSSTACFLFDDVDRMTAATASQLLKILEEPPNPSSMVILVSSFPERVLPTILSRCIRLRFHLLDREETLSVLSQNQITLPEGAIGERLLTLGSPGAIICRLAFFTEGWDEVIHSLTQDLPIPGGLFLESLSRLERLICGMHDSVDQQVERLELFWESLLESLISSPDLKIPPLHVAHALAQAKEVSRRGLPPRSVLESLWIRWNFIDVV